MSHLIDLTGRKFGRWTVLGRHIDSRKYCRWRCRCTCGVERVRLSQPLREGRSRSCGCLSRKLHVIHGHAGTRMYSAWQAMLQRCKNHNDHAYTNYGGRGITVTPRWRIFQHFLDDIGEKPPGLTLGRIDNAKGYSPTNCRWETRLQQQQNMRSNRLLEFHGKRKPLSTWARERGLKYGTLQTRLRLGWSIDRALTEPTMMKFSH